MTDAELVAALANGLDHETWCNRAAPVLDDDDLACADNRVSTARLLLPTVRRVAEQRAAEELRDAADWLDTDPDKGGAPYIAGDDSTLFPHTLEIARVVSWSAASLRDRAAALTATPNHGRNAT